MVILRRKRQIRVFDTVRQLYYYYGTNPKTRSVLADNIVPGPRCLTGANTCRLLLKHTSTGQGTVWENVVDTMLEFPLQQQGPPDPQTPPTPTPLWFIFLNSQTGYGSRAAFFAGMMIPRIQGMVPGLHFLQA